MHAACLCVCARSQFAKITWLFLMSHKVEWLCSDRTQDTMHANGTTAKYYMAMHIGLLGNYYEVGCGAAEQFYACVRSARRLFRC